MKGLHWVLNIYGSTTYNHEMARHHLIIPHITLIAIIRQTDREAKVWMCISPGIQN